MFRVVRDDEAAGTVSQVATGPSSGGQCAAVLTAPRLISEYNVSDWKGQTDTVISSDDHRAYGVAHAY